MWLLNYIFYQRNNFDSYNKKFYIIFGRIFLLKLHFNLKKYQNNEICLTSENEVKCVEKIQWRS